jgi:hypothetical protein
MSRVALATGLLAAACVSVPAPASGKPAPAADSAFDAQVELTDGPGPVPASYHLHGQVLTKLVGLSEDGGPVGVSRATLAAADPLPGALAKLAEGTADRAPAVDTAAATILVRRPGVEKRAVVPRPPADQTAARTLAALDASPVTPVVALELAVLPLAAAADTSGARLVTVRMTVRGVAGAEARVRTADLKIERTAVHPVAPGFTPLPPAWHSVSESAAGPAFRVVKPGAPVDLSLRARVPVVEAFALRAVLAGTVTFNAPGVAEEIAIRTSSAPMTAPAGGSHRE